MRLDKKGFLTFDKEFERRNPIPENIKIFENVVWVYLHGHMVPMFDFELPADPGFVSLQNQLDKLQVNERGPMRMTLEWGDDNAA